MDEYAGRVLAGRYRLPRPLADEFELVETRAFDTYSGQEVLVRQLLLPEIVQADGDGEVPGPQDAGQPGESAQRALEAARAAAAIPDHPSLVQVFDVLIEGGSLWVVSELVPARPVAALLADRKLSPYRAAELAADVLNGLRALHAHGWAHRNITVSTVLVCDDGRAMLDGLAFGAAQEALCGYDPVPEEVLTASAGGEPPERTGWGGPDSALACERARQARITVVGPVTERWAPEQAGPVHDTWPARSPSPPFQGSAAGPRITPPVGPAADLWALGSLLFRCVQGHPPFPEESAAELVQLVRAEPPAYAEECGPLRPVIESLLRQDPAERPEFEQLRGWLRSLIRSAPEPDIGSRTVQVPTGPADPHKLPIVRRRGELVRLRRRRRTADTDAAAAAAHGRHARSRQAGPPAAARPTKRSVEHSTAGAFEQSGAARPSRTTRPPRAAKPLKSAKSPKARRRSPRGLGVKLLGLILVLLLALMVYALMFMPRSQSASDKNALPAQVASGGAGDGGGSPGPSQPAKDAPTPSDRSTSQAPALGEDFSVRNDPAGFSIAVHNGWSRTVRDRQVVFASGGDVFQLIVVHGRDSAASFGDDPLHYELNSEPELASYRASSAWSSYSNLKPPDLGVASATEGEFIWRDPESGRQLYARNLAVLRNGSYDVVLLVGPDDQRTDVSDYFDKAAQTYRAGS